MIFRPKKTHTNKPFYRAHFVPPFWVSHIDFSSKLFFKNIKNKIKLCTMLKIQCLYQSIDHLAFGFSFASTWKFLHFSIEFVVVSTAHCHVKTWQCVWFDFYSTPFIQYEFNQWMKKINYATHLRSYQSICTATLQWRNLTINSSM